MGEVSATLDKKKALAADAKERAEEISDCLLYTSDAADERSSVDLGGRRIIIKKTKTEDASNWIHTS